MAMKRLQTLTRRSHRPSSPICAESTAANGLPFRLSPPGAMPFVPISAQVKNKIWFLNNTPEPPFLKLIPVRGTKVVPNLPFPETKVTTLPNGLRVATESNLAVKTATVGVWIDSGSRYETDRNHGVAHFVEHMIFEGTEQRSARQLEEEIKNMGGQLGAYTSHERTAYYAKVMGKDVPSALEILADILQNSKFEEAMISRERDVILREMEEVVGQTEEVIFDHLHASAFRHSTLGRSIVGSAENIRTMTRDHLEDYVKTHYTARRMVIVVSGPVKHQDVVSQVKSLFTKLPSNSTTSSQLVKENPSIFTGSEVRIIDDDAPLAQFAVAFEGASFKDPDSIALMVMQAMLGSWNKSVGDGKFMGSEMAQRVGISKLAESMVAFNGNYKDTGLFGVHAVEKANCLSSLAWAIMTVITKLVHDVSEVHVTRARNQLKSSLLMQIDGTTSIAEDIGLEVYWGEFIKVYYMKKDFGNPMQKPLFFVHIDSLFVTLLTYGRRIPFVELFDRIDAVDGSTVKRVATRFIYDKDPAIVAMGPIQDLEDYK